MDASLAYYAGGILQTIIVTGGEASVPFSFPAPAVPVTSISVADNGRFFGISIITGGGGPVAAEEPMAMFSSLLTTQPSACGAGDAACQLLFSSMFTAAGAPAATPPDTVILAGGTDPTVIGTRSAGSIDGHPVLFWPLVGVVASQTSPDPLQSLVFKGFSWPALAGQNPGTSDPATAPPGGSNAGNPDPATPPPGGSNAGNPDPATPPPGGSNPGSGDPALPPANGSDPSNPPPPVYGLLEPTTDPAVVPEPHILWYTAPALALLALYRRRSASRD